MRKRRERSGINIVLSIEKYKRFGSLKAFQLLNNGAHLATMRVSSLHSDQFQFKSLHLGFLGATLAKT